MFGMVNSCGKAFTPKTNEEAIESGKSSVIKNLIENPTLRRYANWRIDVVDSILVVVIVRKKIPEAHYRSSRICRVLGNPTAYEILKVLSTTRLTPTDLAIEMGLSLSTICDTLRSLRQLDLVRYETERAGKHYFVKDETILSVMNLLEYLVQRIRTKEY